MTRQLGIEVRVLGVNVVNVLARRADAEAAVVTDVADAVDLIPAARELSGLEMSLVGELARDRFLDRFLDDALKPLNNRYRIVVLDTRPTSGC